MISTCTHYSPGHFLAHIAVRSNEGQKPNSISGLKNIRHSVICLNSNYLFTKMANRKLTNHMHFKLISSNARGLSRRNQSFENGLGLTQTNYGYQVQDAIFSGPEDPGPRTRGPGTHGPELAYTVRIRVSYILSTCISNCSTGMHYGMDYEILCTVDGTFVLAAFIPSTLSDIRRDPFTAGIKGVPNGVH